MAHAQGASYEQLQTFSSILNQIRTNYVDSVTYADLVHAAIDGVLESLDPHSRFLRRADAERELAYDNGTLAGTGIVLDDVDGDLTVVSVLPKTSGAKAGISPGDRLRLVNDTTVFGLTPYDAAHKLIGEKGQKVKLLFERGSKLEPDTVRVGIKFDFIVPHSVGTYRMIDATTGYIWLQGFYLKGGDEVASALKDLKGKGARRLLFDLRGNPGGVMGTAIEIAGLFLPKQTVIFRTQGRRHDTRDSVFTEKDGSFRDLPVMILIDGGSASASEAVASSLQDHDRALILGRRSFGKALVQQALPVPPQGDLVWLTIARILSPSGRVIQRSYHGLKAGQYYSFAGKSGAEQDTLAVFHTDHGRVVRGGGGIVPDIPLPGSVALPPWWSVAVDSGWYEAVADSVAALLPKEPAQRLTWFDARADWQTRLVLPLLARVHQRLAITAVPDSQLSARLGRILAHRASEVRWGPDAGDEFLLHNDPDIRAAMDYWSRLSALLGTGS
jgi:carboxyl-terminal processing protease